MIYGRSVFQWSRPLFSGAILLFALACGSDANGPGVTPGTVASVEVTPPGLSLTVGAQQKLIARVFDAAHVQLNGQIITWTSDAASVATVAQDGTVNGLTAGTAHITATSGGKQASVTVTVTQSGGGGGGGGATGTINVNPAVRYQTISGWEAHSQSGHEYASFDNFADRLFDLAANDLGINRLRLEIRSGLENSTDYYTQWRKGQIDDAKWRCVRFSTVNDNSDPKVANLAGFQFAQLDSMVEKVILPMRQKLAARGERLSVNLLYTAFTGTICSGLEYHHDDSPEEYAEFILVMSEHLRSKYNLVPDTWEVILEPDNTAFWRGKQIGDAIVATAARLSAAGFTPRFIAPSTTRHSNALPYFDAMVQQVPAAAQYMAELSYHRYSSPTDAELSDIGARAKARGINTSMLEHIGSGYADLHRDLKFANISAWEQFALAFPTTDDGAQYYTLDLSSPSNPQINLGSRTKFLRQYFKFIRAGAVRIEATSASGTLDPLAFINTNGGYVVVVKASGAANFTVGGLPAARYGIKYTTSGAYDVDLADVDLAAGTALSAQIPGSGVLTIYRK